MGTPIHLTANTILDYWQEVGRAGRDNRKAYGQFSAVRSLTSGAEENMRMLIKGISLKSVKCIKTYILSELELPKMDLWFVSFVHAAHYAARM